jgi:GcrA cell cycle regulator
MWTDERVELLKELWSKNWSAGMIAKELRVTRNAVIGKAHRLRLYARAKNEPTRVALPTRPLPKRRAGTVAVIGTLHIPKATPKPKLMPPSEPAPVLLPSEPAPATSRKLEDLRNNECRWAYGDAVPYSFCGKPTANNVSYCASHARIVYTS